MGWSDFLNLLPKAAFYISGGRQSGSTFQGGGCPRRQPRGQGTNRPAVTGWGSAFTFSLPDCITMFCENLDTVSPSIASNWRGGRYPFVQLFSLQNDLCCLCVKWVSRDVRWTISQLTQGICYRVVFLSQLRHVDFALLCGPKEIPCYFP